jgi:hypothetical protein
MTQSGPRGEQLRQDIERAGYYPVQQALCEHEHCDVAVDLIAVEGGLQLDQVRLRGPWPPPG